MSPTDLFRHSPAGTCPPQTCSVTSYAGTCPPQTCSITSYAGTCPPQTCSDTSLQEHVPHRPVPTHPIWSYFLHWRRSPRKRHHLIPNSRPPFSDESSAATAVFRSVGMFCQGIQAPARASVPTSCSSVRASAEADGAGNGCACCCGCGCGCRRNCGLVAAPALVAAATAATLRPANAAALATSLVAPAEPPNRKKQKHEGANTES